MSTNSFDLPQIKKDNLDKTIISSSVEEIHGWKKDV